MQRWSNLFIPTLREAPADAEVASHKLLLRAGYIRQLGAGIYSYLPLGQRSINKIVAIVREEMDRIGQEFYLPTLNPRELWEESGRYAVMGDNMFHLKDRKGAELVLAMTHEEVITSIARNELRSYKQLPQIWYQIQTKFRDEPRPKSGLLRVRQFLMKDSYSFDLDTAGLDRSYDLHDAAYRAIFTRCGLEFVAVEADSGAMGGSGSQEFMVYTEAGEDLIASSRDEAGNVVYAANLEKATSQLTPVEDLAPTPGGGSTAGLPELVHTPGQGAIADICAFLNILPSQDIKCVAFMGARAGHPAGEPLRPVVAFLRGDHQVNETKLNTIAGTADLRPMTPDELALYIGGPAGFLGPVGIPQVMTQGSLNGLKSGKPLEKLKGVSRDEPAEGLKTIVIMDLGLEGRANLVAGANQLDFHLRNVTPGRDFTPTVIADIRNVNEGEPDPIAGHPLRLGKAVEVGHIFKLGTKYTAAMGSRVLDANGKEVTPIMGCYGIGIERILTSAIESSAAKFAATQAVSSRPDTDPLSTNVSSRPDTAPLTTNVSSRPDTAPLSTNVSSRPDTAPLTTGVSSRPERSEVERPASGAAPKTSSGPLDPEPSYALAPSIAPYQVVVTVTNVKDADLAAAGEALAGDLDAAGIDVLLDDRDERAGVKFKDAELIGVPFRINIGKKLAEGHVELVNRLTQTTTDVPANQIVPTLQQLLAASN